MPRQFARTLITILTLAVLSQTVVAQNQDQPTLAPLAPSNPPKVELVRIHNDATSTWEYAPFRAPSGKNIIVVTVAQPTHRAACRIQSFTVDHLVCKRPFGKTITYQPQQIAALIAPGDDAVRLRIVLGLNAALGAAIWGTVVLAPVCAPCAIGTGIAALFLFGSAGATLVGDGEPDSLIYLAPGQTLSRKLGYVRRD